MEDAHSLAVQVLTQVEFLAARREGLLVKHADGLWGASKQADLEPVSRPSKRARQDISAAAGAVLPEPAKSGARQGRRCAIM